MAFVRSIGRRARARVWAGGPTSTHRPALPLAEYRALVAYIKRREGHRCLVCRRHRALDPAHIVKRSQGGADSPDNLVALCRECHDACDLHQGLTVVALGHERFTWAWER